MIAELVARNRSYRRFHQVPLEEQTLVDRGGWVRRSERLLARDVARAPLPVAAESVPGDVDDDAIEPDVELGPVSK